MEFLKSHSKGNKTKCPSRQLFFPDPISSNDFYHFGTSGREHQTYRRKPTYVPFSALRLLDPRRIVQEGYAPSSPSDPVSRQALAIMGSTELVNVERRPKRAGLGLCHVEKKSWNFYFDLSVPYIWAIL